MIGSAITGALTQTLSAQPELAARLRPHAGKAVRVVIVGLGESFVVGEDGLPAAGVAAPRDADAEIRVPLDAALRWPVDRIAARGRIELIGDAELAMAVADVLSRSRPDIEEAAARVLGDVPAHRLSELWRRGRDSAADRGRRLAESFGDYVQYEGRLIASRAELDGFNGSVDALRDDVARLETRLKRLEGRH